ncbi:hypothetical protein ACFVUS_27825 [Nocardia sp. NPDC058058]|uniref:hypothetical protein n=1 Tax=Nocardia sp. NPDC058058 TaxID=3346317 RepID=UPI0036DD453D
MDAVYEQYAREMHDRYGYFAIWLPSSRVALGDVGVFVDDRFEKITTLAALGIPFFTEPAGHVTHLDYSSAKAVQVSTEGSAALGDTSTAALTISFGRKGATFFQAAQSREEKLANLHLLEAELRRLHQLKRWSLDHLVVNTVLHTGPTVIFVSNERDAQVALDVRADLLGSPIPIAQASGQLSITRRSGLAANVVAPDGLTPLFRAVQMKKRLGRDVSIQFRGDDEIGLVPVEWEDIEPHRPMATS